LCKDWTVAWVFVLPTAISMGGLIAYPFLRAPYLSFADIKSIDVGEWVGLTNLSTSRNAEHATLMIYIANPLALALTGPLVDRVLEPAVDGPGWAQVAPLVESEAGSGMGRLIVVAGTIIFLLTAGVYAWPRTRSLEADLPDYAA
jgi:hypothetical protein